MRTLIFFFLLSLYSYCSDAQAISQFDIDKRVADVLSNLRELKKAEKMNDQSGQRLVYFDDKEIRLISVKVTGDSTQKNVHWFFDQGRVIFIETVWTEISSGNIVVDEKYYFNNGYLTAWLNSVGQKIPQSSPIFEKVKNELAVYCARIYDENYQ